MSYIVASTRNSSPFRKTIKCHNLATAQGLVRHLQENPAITSIRIEEPNDRVLVASYRRGRDGSLTQTISL